MMSTTWKSLAVGFGLGVVSTGLVALGLHWGGGVLWALTILYIAYTAREAKRERLF